MSYKKKQNKWNNPFYAESRCGKGGSYSQNWSEWKSQKFPKKTIFKTRRSK